MKNIKLNVAKALVLIALFCPVAFAEEGDQGSGGLVGGQTPVITACTNSVESGQGNGATCEDADFIDSVLTSIIEYLGSLVS